MYHLVTGQRRGRFGPRGGHGVTPSGERAWVARAGRQGSPSALRDLDPLRLGHRPATIGCLPDQPSGAAMATVTDLHQLLDQHVVLDLECLDAMASRPSPAATASLCSTSRRANARSRPCGLTCTPPPPPAWSPSAWPRSSSPSWPATTAPLATPALLISASTRPTAG